MLLGSTSSFFNNT